MIPSNWPQQNKKPTLTWKWDIANNKHLKCESVFGIELWADERLEIKARKACHVVSGCSWQFLGLKYKEIGGVISELNEDYIGNWIKVLAHHLRTWLSFIHVQDFIAGWSYEWWYVGDLQTTRSEWSTEILATLKIFTMRLKGKRKQSGNLTGEGRKKKHARPKSKSRWTDMLANQEWVSITESQKHSVSLQNHRSTNFPG